MNPLTQDGIVALKAGDQARARQLFVAALQENGDDLQAWLWLSGAVESDVDRLECLEQVLRIDPSHALAAKGVAQLKAKGVKFPEPSAPARETLEWETFEEREPALTVDSLVPEGVGEEAEALEPAEVPTMDTLLQSEGEELKEKTQPVKIEENGRAARPLEKIILKTRPSILPVLVVGILIAAAAVALVSVLFPWAVRRTSMDANLLFMAVLVVLALLISVLAVRILQHLFTSYILTNRRLIIEDSLVSRAQKSLPLKKIQGISYRQSLLERTFGLGTVMLAANGERGPLYLHDLKDYLDLAERIEATVGIQPRG